jgi:hypothetical protein
MQQPRKSNRRAVSFIGDGGGDDSPLVKQSGKDNVQLSLLSDVPSPQKTKKRTPGRFTYSAATTIKKSINKRGI